VLARTDPWIAHRHAATIPEATVTVHVEENAVMRKSIPAASPDAYVASLDGWRRECVEALRAAVRGAAKFDEVVKWGHLVYLAHGPALLIRAEAERVLFGFWRGRRLRGIEPRLKPGGQYEMATLELREGMAISATKARQLAREAVALNHAVGDPTTDARPARKVTAKAKQAATRSGARKRA
jgi:hypothetical protein